MSTQPRIDCVTLEMTDGTEYVLMREEGDWVYTDGAHAEFQLPGTWYVEHYDADGEPLYHTVARKWMLEAAGIPITHRHNIVREHLAACKETNS